MIFLDCGLRRNDEKNNAFPIFVSPAKAGVQFKVFKRKGPPTNLENNVRISVDLWEVNL